MPIPPVRVSIHLDGTTRDISLSYPLDAEYEGLLHRLRDDPRTLGSHHRTLKGLIECRMHDDDPKLRSFRDQDGRVHGVWLYPRRLPGGAGIILCHWPNSLGITTNHRIPGAMTDEHRRRQEYIALRG